MANFHYSILFFLFTKVIYTARNPKDMCVSFYHYCVLVHNLKGTFEEFCELFLKGTAPIGPVWDHILGKSLLRIQPIYRILKTRNFRLLEQKARPERVDRQIRRNEKRSARNHSQNCSILGEDVDRRPNRKIVRTFVVQQHEEQSSRESGADHMQD